MKLKKLARKALGGLMAMALVTCMLTSCGKSGSSDKLIENIPADANVVMKFNMQQVIENAGCSVDNGKIVLSEKYSDAIRQAAGATALKARQRISVIYRGAQPRCPHAVLDRCPLPRFRCRRHAL